MTKREKKLQNELIGHAYFVVQLSEMINDGNKKDLVNTIQRNTQNLYKQIRWYRMFNYKMS